MAKRRAAVAVKRDVAMSVTRVSVGKEKLVYILVTDKKLRYPGGKSRIAYIGTTRKGITRIAQSVAARSDLILGLRGVRSFDARIITCKPRQNVRTWLRLERALLVSFRESMGEVPKCNTHGKKMKEQDVFALFQRSRIESIIHDLS